MATMTINVKLTDLGLDPDNFTIYPNFPNSDFISNDPLTPSPVSRANSTIDEAAGLTITGVQEGTSIIRVQSTGDCDNFVDLSIGSSGKILLDVKQSAAVPSVSNDYGVTWNDVVFSPALVVYSKDGDIDASGQNQVIVTNNSTFKSTNGGSNFNELENAPLDQKAVAISADGETIVTIPNGTGQYSVSKDGGESWVLQGSNRTADRVHISSDGSKIIVGDGTFLYKAIDGGASEQRLFKNSDEDILYSSSSAMSSDGSVIYTRAHASTVDRYIYKSINEGDSFVVKAQTPSQIRNSTQVSGRGVMACSASGQTLAVTSVYYIAISNDGGDTFTLATPAGVQVVWSDICVSSDGLVIAAVAEGVSNNAPTIFVSRDAGASWAPRSNAASRHSIAVNKL